MRTCFEEICSAVDKAKIELDDMEADLSFYQRENERLLTVCKKRDEECERLQTENAELRNRVIEYSNELVVLLSQKHDLEKQRDLLAEKVGKATRWTDALARCTHCEFSDDCDNNQESCKNAIIRWAEEAVRKAMND